MNIVQHLRQWGNGRAVRLPKKVLEAAQVRDGQALAIHLEGRSIVLTPIENKPKPTIQALLEGVTPEKIGGEMAWGGDLGKENYD